VGLTLLHHVPGEARAFYTKAVPHDMVQELGSPRLSKPETASYSAAAISAAPSVFSHIGLRLSMGM
jgi:hypothetical protein